MATFTNTTKSSAPTYTKDSKASTSFGLINQVRAGSGWLMGQATITMGGVIDVISGNEVFMGALGYSASWTTLSES